MKKRKLRSGASQVKQLDNAIEREQIRKGFFVNEFDEEYEKINEGKWNADTWTGGNASLKPIPDDQFDAKVREFANKINFFPLPQEFVKVNQQGVVQFPLVSFRPDTRNRSWNTGVLCEETKQVLPAFKHYPFSTIDTPLFTEDNITRFVYADRDNLDYEGAGAVREMDCHTTTSLTKLRAFLSQHVKREQGDRTKQLSAQIGLTYEDLYKECFKYLPVSESSYVAFRDNYTVYVSGQVYYLKDDNTIGCLREGLQPLFDPIFRTGNELNADMRSNIEDRGNWKDLILTMPNISECHDSYSLYNPRIDPYDTFGDSVDFVYDDFRNDYSTYGDIIKITMLNCSWYRPVYFEMNLNRTEFDYKGGRTFLYTRGKAEQPYFHSLHHFYIDKMGLIPVNQGYFDVDFKKGQVTIRGTVLNSDCYRIPEGTYKFNRLSYLHSLDDVALKQEGKYFPLETSGGFGNIHSGPGFLHGIPSNMKLHYIPNKSWCTPVIKEKEGCYYIESMRCTKMTIHNDYFDRFNKGGKFEDYTIPEEGVTNVAEYIADTSYMNLITTWDDLGINVNTRIHLDWFPFKFSNKLNSFLPTILIGGNLLDGGAFIDAQEMLTKRPFNDIYSPQNAHAVWSKEMREGDWQPRFNRSVGRNPDISDGADYSDGIYDEYRSGYGSEFLLDEDRGKQGPEWEKQFVLGDYVENLEFFLDSALFVNRDSNLFINKDLVMPAHLTQNWLKALKAYPFTTSFGKWGKRYFQFGFPVSRTIGKVTYRINDTDQEFPLHYDWVARAGFESYLHYKDWAFGRNGNEDGAVFHLGYGRRTNNPYEPDVTRIGQFSYTSGSGGASDVRLVSGRNPTENEIDFFKKVHRRTGRYEGTFSQMHFEFFRKLFIGSDFLEEGTLNAAIEFGGAGYYRFEMEDGQIGEDGLGCVETVKPLKLFKRIRGVFRTARGDKRVLLPVQNFPSPGSTYAGMPRVTNLGHFRFGDVITNWYLANDTSYVREPANTTTAPRDYTNQIPREEQFILRPRMELAWHTLGISTFVFIGRDHGIDKASWCKNVDEPNMTRSSGWWWANCPHLEWTGDPETSRFLYPDSRHVGFGLKTNPIAGLERELISTTQLILGGDSRHCVGIADKYGRIIRPNATLKDVMEGNERAFFPPYVIVQEGLSNINTLKNNGEELVMVIPNQLRYFRKDKFIADLFPTTAEVNSKTYLARNATQSGKALLDFFTLLPGEFQRTQMTEEEAKTYIDKGTVGANMRIRFLPFLSGFYQTDLFDLTGIGEVNQNMGLTFIDKDLNNRVWLSPLGGLQTGTGVTYLAPESRLRCKLSDFTRAWADFGSNVELSYNKTPLPNPPQGQIRDYWFFMENQTRPTLSGTRI